jgi:23S rRNA (uracil1939-C5)-methyltransferase
MRSKRTETHPEKLVELVIERLGSQGDGIARHAGETVFLPFTVPGDRALAQLGARRAGGREGRIAKQLTCGPGRADPPCGHFGVCGGCSLQHLDSPLYREVKLAGLHAALARLGIDPGVVAPLRVVPPRRRRARLGLFRPRDPRLAPRIGFRERYRHELVDLEQCLVLERPLFAVAQALRQTAERILPSGAAAEVTVTRTDSGIDLLIEAAEDPALSALEALAECGEECDLARVVWRACGSETSVVERRPVRVMLSGVAVSYPPGAFLQASEAAEGIVVEEVLAGIGCRRPALDLFAGLGSFAFALALAGPVHAVEGEPKAAAALARAAAGVAHVSAERRDLAHNPLEADEFARYAAAVFDPPRSGAARQAQALAASKLERVVAVSCNPATFARDAATLIAGGFQLERVTPVDQFVWTSQLELAALFRR